MLAKNPWVYLQLCRKQAFHVLSLISRGCPPAPFPPLAPIAPLLPLRGTYLTVQDPWKNLRWFHRTCGLSRLSHGLKWFKTRTGWWCNNHLEKYESQWEGLSHILWKIKNVPNHQPENAKWRCSLFHVAMKHSGMYERMPSAICELRRTSKIIEHHCNDRSINKIDLPRSFHEGLHLWSIEHPPTRWCSQREVC